MPLMRSNSSLPCRLLLRPLALIGLLLAIVCLLPTFGAEAKLKKLDGRHQIDQMEESWRTAMLRGDTAAMAPLLADDYMGISANGTLHTRDQMLDFMRRGRIHLNVLLISDRKVRFYGKTAVVTSFAHIEGTSFDGDLNGNFRYTRVYVKGPQGDWKIVSFEASRIRTPGLHHHFGK